MASSGKGNVESSFDTFPHPPLFPDSLPDVSSTFEKAEENLRQVLEVTKVGQGSDVAGKGFGVVLVKPYGGSVVAFLVGFSGTANAAEVTDEFKGSEGVVVPGMLEALG